ncbi:MAG: potassium channel family protein [Eubacterium sp.]
MKELAIFGMGRFGRSMAITYSNLGGKVIAVDKLQEKVDEIADYVTYALRADVTDENVIKGLGVSNVDMAVVAMSDNFEASIIVTTVCKELGIPYIVAKAKNPLQGNVLKKVGADELIFPEIETGERMAKNLAHGDNFIDIAEISNEFSIIEAKVPVNWVGKTLMELNPRSKYGFNVIAAKIDGKFEINLDVDRPFADDMQLVVLGGIKELAKVFK